MWLDGEHVDYVTRVLGAFWCRTRRKLEWSNMITGQRMMVQTVERENGGEWICDACGASILARSNELHFMFYRLCTLLIPFFSPFSFMPGRITIDLPTLCQRYHSSAVWPQPCESMQSVCLGLGLAVIIAVREVHHSIALHVQSSTLRPPRQCLLDHLAVVRSKSGI